MLGLEHVGKLVPLHRENLVLEFLRKLAALINAKKAALILGAAVGVALGNLAKVFPVLNALEGRLRFLLQRGQLIRALTLRVDLNFAQRDLLRTHKFGLMRFVILRNFVFRDSNV